MFAKVSPCEMRVCRLLASAAPNRNAYNRHADHDDACEQSLKVVNKKSAGEMMQ
jgi:hypothetical protein